MPRLCFGRCYLILSKYCCWDSTVSIPSVGLSNTPWGLQLYLLWNGIWSVNFVIMEPFLILAQKKCLTMKHQVTLHLDLSIVSWVLSDLTKHKTKWAQLSIVTWKWYIWEWAWAEPRGSLDLPGPVACQELFFKQHLILQSRQHGLALETQTMTPTSVVTARLPGS